MAANKGLPKSKKYWNNLRPSSLRDALKACKDFAQAIHNLSVERIAENMGLDDHWALYKWISNGRMPAVLIPAYEAACGIDYVSRWLATRNGNLVIQLPTGRKIDETDVSALQKTLHHTVSALMAFYAGNSEATETLEAVANSMTSLAWHKGNVEQFDAPQLDLS